MSSFGHSRFDKPSPVQEVFERTDLALDSISSKMVTMEAYETLYGICNHDQIPLDSLSKKSTRPLALVALHKKENISEYSKLYRTIQRYTNQRIFELFHISLIEFLNLPREITQLLFKISYDDAVKEAPKINKALNELNKGM